MPPAKNGPVPEIPMESPVYTRRALRGQIQEVDASEPQNSATVKLAENQIVFCTRIDNMDEDLVALGRDMILGFAGLSTKIDDKFDGLLGALAGVHPASLPPMRRRQDSEHVIEEVARSEGAGGRVQAQQIIDDPHAELTPDVVEDMIRTGVKSALEKQREIDRVKKLEADVAATEAKRTADAAEKERLRLAKEASDTLDASNKRNAKYLTWSGIVVGLVVLAATTAVAFTQGRAAEHDKQFAEKLATSVPVLPVVVSTTVAAAPASASGGPLTAPATVAPGPRPR
jgi:hypothetical protein